MAEMARRGRKFVMNSTIGTKEPRNRATVRTQYATDDVDRMAKKKMMWFGIIGVKKLDKKGYTAQRKEDRHFAAAVFVVSVIVFMAIALLGNFSEVLKVASTANLWIYLLAFVANFAGFLLKYCKWTYYIKELGLKVPARKNFANLNKHVGLFHGHNPGKDRQDRGGLHAETGVITSIKFAVQAAYSDDGNTSAMDFLGTAILALVASLYLNRYVVVRNGGGQHPAADPIRFHNRRLVVQYHKKAHEGGQAAPPVLDRPETSTTHRRAC